MFKFVLLAASLVVATFSQAVADDGRFVYRYRGSFDDIVVTPEPPAEGTALTLYGATFKAQKGRQFSFDLSQLVKTSGIDAEDVTFKLSPGASKPTWLTLSSSGEVGGIPGSDGIATISIEASGGGSSMTNVYTIEVFSALYAKKVVNGDMTSCAVTLTDGAKCWGYGREGQIGSNPPVRESKVAISVQGLEGQVKDLALGFSTTTCAVTLDNAVKCWGRVLVGSSSTNVPTVVPGLESHVASLAIGQNHACAAKDDGTVWCWGNNDSGQLGVEGVTSSVVPIRASNISAKVRTLHLGGGYSCGVTDQGGAVCWGRNNAGQLGNGTRTWDFASGTNTPWPYQSQVVGLESGVVSLGTGYGHACAVLDAGSMKCWGDNTTGSLGTGVTGSSGLPALSPVDAVVMGGGILEAGAGIQYTCTRHSGGSVKCVGWGRQGRLGAGAGAPWEYPTNTMPLPDVTVENGFIELSASPTSPTPLAVLGLQTGVRQISVGETGGCAVMGDNLVKCWGENYNAQRGDGTYNDAWSPVTVHDGDI